MLDGFVLNSIFTVGSGLINDAQNFDFLLRPWRIIRNSRLDYLFLHTISALKKARKTDLINICHLEYTTGMDTICRLINNGLLSESPLPLTNVRGSCETGKKARYLQGSSKKEACLTTLFLTVCLC